MRAKGFGLIIVAAAASVGMATGAQAGEAAKLVSLTTQEAGVEPGKAQTLNLKSVDVKGGETSRTLDLGYEIRMGGLLLASIDLKAIMESGHYVVTSLIATKGLADFFASSNVQALATGDVNGHSVVPRTYNSDIEGGNKHQLVGLLFGDKGPTSIDAAPPYDARFPVSDEQKLSSVDPVSSLLYVALGQSATQQAPCGVSVPVFDGRRRYDLKLSFDKNDDVSTGRKGPYNGPALHCIARYQRVAGFKPPKHGHKVSEIPPIDVWLAPLSDGSFLVPVRMQLDSEFGGIVAKAVRLKFSEPGHPG
jgi:hypothetical protein